MNVMFLGFFCFFFCYPLRLKFLLHSQTSMIMFDWGLTFFLGRCIFNYFHNFLRISFIKEKESKCVGQTWIFCEKATLSTETFCQKNV